MAKIIAATPKIIQALTQGGAMLSAKSGAYPTAKKRTALHLPPTTTVLPCVQAPVFPYPAPTAEQSSVRPPLPTRAPPTWACPPKTTQQAPSMWRPPSRAECPVSQGPLIRAVPMLSTGVRCRPCVLSSHLLSQRAWAAGA